MRPLASSSFSMEGMLFSTFTCRRAAQKPEAMVTACMGTFRNLAWGDLTRFSTPSSFHSKPVEAPTAAEPDGGSFSLDRGRLLSGRAAIVAAEMAEPTNWRREISGLFVIPTSLRSCGLAGIRGIHLTFLKPGKC